MAFALVRWPRGSAGCSDDSSESLLPVMMRPHRHCATTTRVEKKVVAAAADPKTPVPGPNSDTEEPPTSDAAESPTSEVSDDETVCVDLYSTPLAEDKVIFISRL